MKRSCHVCISISSFLKLMNESIDALAESCQANYSYRVTCMLWSVTMQI
jgi:hypothetical protein